MANKARMAHQARAQPGFVLCGTRVEEKGYLIHALEVSYLTPDKGGKTSESNLRVYDTSDDHTGLSSLFVCLVLVLSQFVSKFQLKPEVGVA